MPPLRIATRLAVVALLFAAAAGSAVSQSGPAIPLHLYTAAYGAIFEADLTACSVREVARTDRTALELAADSEGRYWGRYRETSLACFDPAQGTITARIRLSDAPYRILVAPDGRAWVSHNTLTAHGFALSVLDLAAAKVVGRIQGVPGIVTDMALAGESLYVATLGVEKTGSLMLSRIELRSGILSEVYRAPKGGYVWRLASSADALYLVPERSASGPVGVDPPPSLVVVPLRGGEPREQPLQGELKIGRIVGGGYLQGGTLFLPCRDRRGGYGIAAVDLAAFRVSLFLPVSRAVNEILYVGQERCVARDGLLTAGPEGVALVFIDLKEGKEVSVVPLLRHSGN